MPIYAYRCAACGHAKDVLQRMSDPVLSICPVCGEEAFAKQLTAAGFQLKGSGWYATDFKSSGAAPAAKTEAGDGAAVASTDAKTDAKTDGKSDGKSDSATPAASPSSTPAATPAPASATPSAGGSA